MKKLTVMTELKDVIHLYLGCEVRSLDGGTMTYIICGIDRDGNPIFKTKDGGFSTYLSRYNIVLRPLSDMTEEEFRELAAFQKIELLNGFNIDLLNVEQFKYLLSIRIDLFGLIESGQAIDATITKHSKTNAND